MTTVQAAACADSRRSFLTHSAVALASTALPAISFAQSPAPTPRQFSPVPRTWRTPTGGLVRKTALAATRGAKTDVEKARKRREPRCSQSSCPPSHQQVLVDRRDHWVLRRLDPLRSLLAHDLGHVSLPHAKDPKLGFFMYPIAETAAGRLDSYEPDQFKYQITSTEVKA